MKIEIKVPNLGESITEATVCHLIKENDTIVQVDEEIIELETDKVNQTLNAPKSGKITYLVQVDEKVQVGQALATIDTEQDLEKENQSEDKSSSLKESKIDEVSSEAEGKKSVVSKDIKEECKKSLDQNENGVEKEESKITGNSEKEQRVKMSHFRKVISEKLVQAKNECAILTTFNEVNMQSVMDFRIKEQANFTKKYGIKLGLMSFFVKAVVAALSVYPELNAYIEKEDIVYRKYYNIGIAVGSKKGLFVPVLRECDKKTFSQIEKEIKDLSEKVHSQKIAIEDLQDAGFTISNGGVYGSLFSTPILNPPQSGILGMHAIEKRPVVIEDTIVICPMMYLALSYDHRIIDGEQAIGFLGIIKKYIEDPTTLLVEL